MARTRIVVGFTGDDGVRLGVRLLQRLHDDAEAETHLVMCGCGRDTLVRETGMEPADVLALADRTYHEWNQAARISSGSFLTRGMVVAPCSTRSLASIACGYANNLVHRAADVTLKEGRPLVVAVRRSALGEVDEANVTRLRSVPGTRLMVVDPHVEASPALLDATIDELLAPLGIELPARVG